ncbi:tRNA threonylcarbamoyladenosine biosynthesis protein TsaB [Hydrogenivirga sp.]
MRILSLDTSFSFFNLSVVEDGKVVLIHYVDLEKKTLENLPHVLAELCIKPSDFDAFAVSVGVGYLTSIRIGITFMRTTAYTLKKPIVSYENLYLLGRFTPAPLPKLPFLRVSTNVFYRVFEEDGVSDVKLFKGERLTGFGISLEVFSGEGITEEKFLHPFFPFSAYGGVYAHEFLKENPEGESIFDIEPLYMKPPV